MGEFLTRVKLGIVKTAFGIASALIAVGAIFLGLSDIGPNLFRALVGAVVFRFRLHSGHLHKNSTLRRLGGVAFLMTRY
ncbi:hypothetical protein C8039_19135 [Halogeometricum sp. wsp3]|nr:hypothetical protein C8039_19135 [Halogeometricum sp. wsp3]